MINGGQIRLTENLRVELKHSAPVKEGAEAWRIIVSFISDYPDKDRIIKDYYIWVTGEYLEDRANLTADIESAKKFALTWAKKRFEECDNQVPLESGISCSNKEGLVFVGSKEENDRNRP